MESACDQLLSGPGFSGNKRCGIAWRHAPDLIQRASKSSAVTYELGKIADRL